MPEKMSEKPQVQVKHPPQYRDDLNADQIESQNLGEYQVSADENAKRASSYADLVDMFSGIFTMDDLHQMPIVPVGTALKQGAVYLDLAARDSGPIVAYQDMQSRADQFLVPKSEVPYELWNRMVMKDS